MAETPQDPTPPVAALPGTPAAPVPRATPLPSDASCDAAADDARCDPDAHDGARESVAHGDLSASAPDGADETSTEPSERPRGRSRSARDRARRRAVRAHAAQTGVAYSVAARQLAAAGLSPGETLGNTGRTVYPAAFTQARGTIIAREVRPAPAKLTATRTAARLPTGRARHLTDRFPPGETAGLLFYDGDLRAELLAMAYLAAAHEAPGLVPPPLDLAWTAELGEETAVDMACADLDRATRSLLSDRAAQRWHRIETALSAATHHPEPATRYAADLLTLVYRRLTTPTETTTGDPCVPATPWPGARQTLDALLVVADDGHAPGTRIRLPGKPPHRAGTILGAHWSSSGSPIAYDIALDDDPTPRTVLPPDLVILPSQESDAPALTH